VTAETGGGDAAPMTKGREDATFGRSLAAAWTIARKDLLLEVRSKQSVPLSITLALLIVVVFAFSVPGARNGSGALWTAFVFAGMLGVMQSLAVETRNRALDGLVLAPIPPAAIYVGKVVSNAVFATLVGLTTLGAVGVFLHAPLPATSLPTAVAVIVLFAFGFAAVSVVVGIITTVTGISQLLLPVLLLPLLLPALLAGVAQFETGRALWFGVLAGYDGVVFVAGALVFGELVG